MKKFTLFYADDDEDDLDFFKDAVKDISKESNGVITLFLHKNGTDLLNNIKNNFNNNSIAFLDLNMPIKTGFEILEEIRNVPEINAVPIIIYSTSCNTDDINMSYNLGANLYVQKPTSFQDLIKIISNMISIDWEKREFDLKNFVYKASL